MEKNLFREKSLKNFESPEQMGDYIRVTSPKVWILMVTVLVIIVAFFILCRTYSFETAADVATIVSDGKGYILVHASDIAQMEAITTKSRVILDEKYYTIDSFDVCTKDTIGDLDSAIGKLYVRDQSINAEKESNELSDYYLIISYTPDADTEPGYHDAKLMLKQENAFEFLFGDKEE